MDEMDAERIVRSIVNRDSPYTSAMQLALVSRRLKKAMLLKVLEKLTGDFGYEGIWAIHALVGLDEQRAQQTAIRWLNHPNHNARSIGLDILLRHWVKDAPVDKVIDLARNDPDENVRYRSILILGEIGDERALEVLEWIKDNDEGENWEGEPLKYTAECAICQIQQRLSSAASPAPPPPWAG